MMDEEVDIFFGEARDILDEAVQKRRHVALESLHEYTICSVQQQNESEMLLKRANRKYKREVKTW